MLCPQQSQMIAMCHDETPEATRTRATGAPRRVRRLRHNARQLHDAVEMRSARDAVSSSPARSPLNE
jgi:hypothetical protein